MKDFIQFLKTNSVSWRRIFWKVWARTLEDECKECGVRFTAAGFTNCVYHPRKPHFPYGSNKGAFPCCNQEATRFTILHRVSGCCNKEHIPTNLRMDQVEWRWIQKHLEILVEPHPSLPGSRESLSSTVDSESGTKPQKANTLSLN